MTTPELIRAAMEESATFFRTMADYSLMDEGQALVNMLEKYSPCADPYKAARAHLEAAAKSLDVESELAQVLGVLGTMPEFTIAPEGADKRHHYLRYLGAALALDREHGAALRALVLRLEARQLLVPKVDTTTDEVFTMTLKEAGTQLLERMEKIDSTHFRTIEGCKSKLGTMFKKMPGVDNGKTNHERRFNPEVVDLCIQQIVNEILEENDPLDPDDNEWLT